MAFDASLRQGLLDILNKAEEEHKTPELMPGAKEILDYLDGRVKLAIVTGNGRPITEETLEQLGLKKYFKAVMTREDGMKPLPDGINKALSVLDVTPAEAIFVGDGHADILAAKAAGVTMLSFASVRSPDLLREMGADFVIKSLLELKELIK